MKIILLTQFFLPEPADYKNHVLAKELATCGHDVIVLTTFPNHPLGRIYEGYRQSWRSWEWKDGYRVLRLPIYPDHSMSSFKRALNYLSFTLFASTIGVLLSGRPDLVLVHATPITLGWVAGIFKGLYKSRVILDVLDIWPDALISSGIPSTSSSVKIAGGMAQIAYWCADKINVPTEGFRNRLLKFGVSKNKVSIVPIWASNEHFHMTIRNEEFGKKHGLDGKFCIFYAGNIGTLQNLKNIIDAALLMKEMDQVRFVFVGDGREAKELRNYVEENNITSVIFAGSHPKESISSILSWADALLVSLVDDDYLADNFPSKISGYLAVGRPILACAKGEAQRIVEENGIGFHCLPDNPLAFKEIIKKLMALSSEERKEMGMRSRALFTSYYDKDIIINKYLDMITNV